MFARLTQNPFPAEEESLRTKHNSIDDERDNGYGYGAGNNVERHSVALMEGVGGYCFLKGPRAAPYRKSARIRAGTDKVFLIGHKSPV